MGTRSEIFAIVSCDIDSRWKKRAETTGTAYYGSSKMKFPIHYKAFINMHARKYNASQGRLKAASYISLEISPDYEKSLVGIANFIADLGPIPFDIARPSVDREDNSKGYEPGNIRWLSLTENSRDSAIRNPIATRVSSSVSTENMLLGQVLSPFALKHREQVEKLQHILESVPLSQKYIADSLNIKSTGNVRVFLNALVKKNFLTYEIRREGKQNYITLHYKKEYND